MSRQSWRLMRIAALSLGAAFTSVSANAQNAQNAQNAGAPEISAASSADFANRCPTFGRAVGDGVVPVGVVGADFGTVPEACIGADAALRVRGTLLVAPDNPDFYGNVAAAAGLRLRQSWGPRWMVWFAADVATYRFVQNAAIKASAVDMGPATLGAGRALLASPRLALTVFSRVMLPFDSARKEGREFGGDLGLTATGASAVRPWLGGQGGAVLSAPVVVVGGQTHGAVRAGVVAEAWVSGHRWAGTIGGVGRLQVVPRLDGMSSLALRAGGRCAFDGGAWLAAVTEVPLVGGDRTDLIFALWAGIRPAGGHWGRRRP